jgi:hypothetical protein
MADLISLETYQAGEETDWGDVVAPTVKLMGIDSLQITPHTQVVRHKDRRASLAPSYASDIYRTFGEGQVSGRVLYEDICYWLDNLFGEATPSGEDPWTRAYAAPLSAVPSGPKVLSIVKGTGSEVYSLAGGLVNGLTISGRTGEALKFSAPLIGKVVATDGLEALSDRAVNTVMADHVAVYIDAWGGTLGATQFEDVIFSFELNVQPNRALVYGMGSAAPTTWREAAPDGWEGSLKMTLEFSAVSKAFLDAIIGASAVFQKMVRIKASNTANLDLQIDFAGTQEDAPVIFTDDDGVVTVEFELMGEYNSVMSNWLEITSINQVSALP